MRTFILYTLLLTSCKLSSSAEQPSEAQVDQDAFQKLLKQVDPPALHAALHDFSPKRFAHGMFPEDRTALEAIHKEEPRVATGILKMAKLAKRQDNSTTTPSPAPNPQTSSTPLPESSSPSPSPSSAGGESSTPASTTAAPSSSNSMGEVVSSTDAEGRVVVSTIGGGATTLSPSSSSMRSSRTSTLLQTSTQANGQQSTITAVTVVGGDEGSSPTGTETQGANGASSGQPGLQTGEAAMTRGCGKEFAVVFGAAVGVAFML